MPDTIRTMINIDTELHDQMRALSLATGIPIGTFGKFLVDSGRPIIKTMSDAILERNDFTVNKLDSLSGIIDNLIGEGQQLTYLKQEKEMELDKGYQQAEEHQHELENLDKQIN